MKAVKIVTVVIVIAHVLGALVVIFADTLIRKGIERMGSRALGVEVELADADLSILKGQLTLSDLRISNPEGFTTDRLFEMETARVTMNPSSIFQDELSFESIILESPSVIVEQSDHGTNMEVLSANMGGEGESEQGEQKEQRAYHIKKLTVTGAKVTFAAFSKEGEPVTVPLPDMELENLSSGEGSGMMMSQIEMLQAALAP